eukprot:Seg4461.4 transcript_id=Seg4461.4/GoldUCD/mRNA.D3Y31 product="putative protein y4fB" protein_id=Seg4461.4/GoldUCD/D3Y31
MEKENMERPEVLLKENSDGLQCTERMTRCKDAVCYVYAYEGENIRRGTGFFTKITIKGIDIKCIATNNHVIPSIEIAETGSARFYYEGHQQGVDVKLEPEVLFYTHQELDYTLIGCKSERIENELCITPLKFGNSTGNVGDDIFIFQHPKGESKKVSYQKISNIIPPYLFYKADTDIGSSGSPVLRQFQLLAIHSKGSDELKYNKGTLCSEIIQHLTYGTYTKPTPVMESAITGRKRESSQLTTNEHSPAKKQKSDGTNSSKNPNERPGEKDLQALAKDIITDWKSLGRELEINHKEIMKIHKDNINYDDIEEKAFAMLVKWKESKAENATYGTLKAALINMELVSTAQKHC